MAHKDICIKFKVKGRFFGRCFEAVGVLNEDEGSVSGDTVLERVPDAIGEEDEAFLNGRLAQLPTELRNYWLVTNRRDVYQRSVLYFSWNDYFRRWNQWCWYYLGDRCYSKVLVLRRCKKATPGTKAA